MTSWASLIVPFSIAVFAVSAQQIEWVTSYDTGKYDHWPSGAIDPWGNVILCGQTSDDNVGTNPVITIIKYTPDGETLWARTYDSEKDDVCNRCAVGNEGGVVVAGYYYPSTGCELIKYDRNGNLLWVRSDTNPANYRSYFMGVTIDESLNIYASGITEVRGNEDWLLRKYDANGNLRWSRTYDFGNDCEGINALALTPDGNIVGCGTIGSWEYWTFDFFIAKFTRNGDTIWTRRLNVKNEDWGAGVAVDYFGNVYGTGDACQYLNGWIVPDSCVTFKYSPDGEFLWVRLTGFDDCSEGSAIIYDSLGKLIVAGSAYDSLGYSSNAFLINYQTDGTQEWHWLYCPEPYSCGFTDIATPSSGVLYAFGQVYNENYDPSDFLAMKIRYPSGIGVPIATSAPSATLRLLSPSLLRRGEPVRLLAYRSGEYQLTLWDMTGRKVSDVYNGYLLEGTHRFAINCLTTGTYMLMVQTKYGMEKKRLTVVK